MSGENESSRSEGKPEGPQPTSASNTILERTLSILGNLFDTSTPDMYK
jgi:hypothetical protein